MQHKSMNIIKHHFYKNCGKHAAVGKLYTKGFYMSFTDGFWLLSIFLRKYFH